MDVNLKWLICMVVSVGNVMLSLVVEQPEILLQTAFICLCLAQLIQDKEL